MSCATELFQIPQNYINLANTNNAKTQVKAPVEVESRQRRISSSALYEVHRKDLNDVCYLFVPDEYVSQ